MYTFRGNTPPSSFAVTAFSMPSEESMASSSPLKGQLRSRLRERALPVWCWLVPATLDTLSSSCEHLPLNQMLPSLTLLIYPRTNIYGIWSHHFMADRWGKKWKQWQVLFSWVSKSLWRVRAARSISGFLLRPYQICSRQAWRFFQNSPVQQGSQEAGPVLKFFFLPPGDQTSQS